MGLLEGCDRRNQRVLHYQNAMAKNWSPRLNIRRLVVGVAYWIVLYWAFTMLVLDEGEWRWGLWSEIAFFVFGGLVLVVCGVLVRRKRLAWEAERAEKRRSC